MNICLVHEEYPEETNFGGIATYQKTLAEELVKKGNNVYVICRGLKESKIYYENGVKIHRIYVKKSNNQTKDYIRYRKKVSKLLKELQEEDLIDILETPDWGAETIFFEPFRKVPLIVRLHTPLKIWLKYNQNDFGKITKKLLWWEQKMILSADYITCCSQFLKKKIVNEMQINSTKTLVTPNPANITDFYNDCRVEKENKLLFVGSLEERKGVCVLAKALNIVFAKHPNLKIDFIGKDTTRNSENISTQTLIKRIIDKKYHKNINFIGHISNQNLNKHLNSSLVGVFPSLFDNFPYVVLESMATGLHIVGSENSGMVEMLNDNSSIYKTGNEIDLAQKIIEKYKLSLKEKICTKNIERVKDIYNASKVCDELLTVYKKVISNYNCEKNLKDDLSNILKNITAQQLKSLQKEKMGVANKVYKVKTNERHYIIKKYLYECNFELADQLYKIYENNYIDVIKPLMTKPIYYKNFYYNIFEYRKHKKINKKLDYEYLKNIICCSDREIKNIKISNSALITNKIQKYYIYLKENVEKNLNLNKEEVKYVLGIYDEIKNKIYYKETYLNHGDISYQNILLSGKQSFLIDFDEACIAPRLYDFAVIVIKMITKNMKINKKKYNKLVNVISKKFSEYNKQDYINIIKFYLCKILLEKYYLHEQGKIDLFSKEQLADNYKKYLELLKNTDKDYE